MNSFELNGAFADVEAQIREMNRQKSGFEDYIEVLKNEESAVIQISIENEKRKAAGLDQKKIVVDHTLTERNDLKVILLNRLASFEENKINLMAQIRELKEEHQQRRCELNERQQELKNSCDLYRLLKDEFDVELKALDNTYQDLDDQNNNNSNLFNTMDNDLLELNQSLYEVNNEISTAETKITELIEQMQMEESVRELILVQIQNNDDEHQQKIHNNGKEYENSERAVNDEWSELDAELMARKIRLAKLIEEFALGNEELGQLSEEQVKINEMEVQGMKEAQESEDEITMIECEIKEDQDELDAKKNELEFEILAHDKEMEECGKIQLKLDTLKENEIELVSLVEEEELVVKSGKEAESSLNNLKFQNNQLFFEKFSVESSSRMLMEFVLDAKNQLKIANLELQYLRTSERYMYEEHEKLNSELGNQMKEIMGLFSQINKDEQKQAQLEDKDDENSMNIENNEIGSVESKSELVVNDQRIVVTKPLSRTKITLEEVDSTSKSKLSPLKKETIPEPLLDQSDYKSSSELHKILNFPEKQGHIIKTKLASFFDNFNKKKNQDQGARTRTGAGDNTKSSELDKTLIFPICPPKEMAQVHPKEKQGNSSNSIKKTLSKAFENLTHKKVEKTVAYPALPLIRPSTSTSSSGNGNLKLEKIERVKYWNIKNSSEAVAGSSSSVKAAILHIPLKSILKNGNQKPLNEKRRVTFNNQVKVKVFYESPCSSITPEHSTSGSDSDSDYEPAKKKKANCPSSSSSTPL